MAVMIGKEEPRPLVMLLQVVACHAPLPLQQGVSSEGCVGTCFTTEEHLGSLTTSPVRSFS